MGQNADRSYRNAPRSPAAVATPAGAVSPWVQLRSASGNPLIYKRMVRAADPAARPGDVVNIYDKSGFLFGRGLYNPRSMIALRVLTHRDRAIDDAFWQEVLGRAVELRRRLRIDEVSDAYRLVHAEGDGLSGLIVEKYADVLVFEVFSLGMYQRCQMMAQIIGTEVQRHEGTKVNQYRDRKGAGLNAEEQRSTIEDRKQIGNPSIDNRKSQIDNFRLVVRADDFIERTEGFRVDPALQPDVGRLIIREHGVRYRIDVAGGHKTGFFCDQRDNRRQFAQLCRDASVLDLCCYTGGFSVCAKVLGGAREVIGVDLDEAAIAIAKENANLNQARIDFVHSDAFIYLRQMIANGRKFDAVVLDPPKFAGDREGIEEALIKYHDLNSLAMQVVREGGIFVTCSCSGLVSREVFKSTVIRAARRAKVMLQILAETGAGPDHPVMMNCPESEYLKVIWARAV